MAIKRYSESSVRARLARQTIKDIDDSEINFDDIPPITKEQFESFRKVGRPLLGNKSRKMISIRMDLDVLDQLKAEAKSKKKPYQSLISDVLSQYVNKKKSA